LSVLGKTMLREALHRAATWAVLYQRLDCIWGALYCIGRRSGWIQKSIILYNYNIIVSILALAKSPGPILTEILAVGLVRYLSFELSSREGTPVGLDDDSNERVVGV